MIKKKITRTFEDGGLPHFWNGMSLEDMDKVFNYLKKEYPTLERRDLDIEAQKEHFLGDGGVNLVLTFTIFVEDE